MWGKGDQLGTVNLLTDEVVARAAKEEIRLLSPLTLCKLYLYPVYRTGKSVCLNWWVT